MIGLGLELLSSPIHWSPSGPSNCFFCADSYIGRPGRVYGHLFSQASIMQKRKHRSEMLTVTQQAGSDLGLETRLWIPNLLLCQDLDSNSTAY